MLTGQRKALAARHAQARAVDRAELCDRLGDTGQEMLGVVDHDQDAPAGEALGQRRCDRIASGTADLQGLRDGREHQSGILERRKRYPPDAVGEAVGGAGRGLQRQPRLPDPAGTGQGDEPHILAGEQLSNGSERVLPPEERRGRHGQVRAVEAAERREALLAELEEPHGSREILEAVLAEVHHLVGDVRPRGIGQHHLPAVRDACDPRSAMHVESHVAALLDQREPCVDADPHPHRAAVECGLHRACGGSRRCGRRKGREEAVALRTDLRTAVLGERGPHDRPVLA